jgi:hypothetical protein
MTLGRRSTTAQPSGRSDKHQYHDCQEKAVKTLNKHEFIIEEIAMAKLQLFMLTHGYPFEVHEVWCLGNKHKPYTPQAINAHVVDLSQKIEQLKGCLSDQDGDRQPAAPLP